MAISAAITMENWPKFKQISELWIKSYQIHMIVNSNMSIDQDVEIIGLEIIYDQRINIFLD